MAGKLLLRGMLAGLAAAVLAFAVAWVVGEPQIDRAIAFEEEQTHATGDGHEHEDGAVSRVTQQTLGLATALGFYGVAVGGVFALVFAFCYGRVGRLDARATSALLAVVAFGTVVLVPSLKYPANPPAYGTAETVDQRTVLYFAMIAISVLLAVAAVQLGQRLAGRYGAWNGAVAGLAVFVGTVAVAFVAMPEITEAPAGFPAEVLWDFRIAGLATHAALWATLGVTFGILAARLLERRASAPLPSP